MGVWKCPPVPDLLRHSNLVPNLVFETLAPEPPSPPKITFVVLLGPLRVPVGDDWVGVPPPLPDFSPSRFLFLGLRLETEDRGRKNK